MKKPIALIVGILSLFSLGQQLLIKTGFILSSVGIMVLVPEKIYAENEDFNTTWGNKKEESVDHYGVTLKNIRKLQESQLNDSYDATSEFDHKKKMEIYEGISKYTKAIEFNQNNRTAYYNRGILRRKLGDYYGAISDYTKAIEINPKYANALANRGSSKKSIGDMQGACDDWIKASSLGHEDATQSVRNQC